MASERASPGSVPWSPRQILLAQAAAGDSVQNIQRLLKLLADRYPGKYRAVDPGRVDGALGLDTREAIRKFQKMSGIVPGSQTNEQLVANILAELAAMSATQPAEGDTATRQASGAAPPPKPAAPESSTGEPAETRQSGQTQAGPTAQDGAATPADPQESRQAAGTSAPEAARDVDTPAVSKPVPTASAGGSRPPPSRKPAIAAASAIGGKPIVYFVQAASLRSLAAAKREWHRILDENRTVLAGEQVYFEQADVKDRGIFHRILIGPISQKETAATLCASLVQNRQQCVVTQRRLKDLQESGKQQRATESPATPPATPSAEAAPRSSPPMANGDKPDSGTVPPAAGATDAATARAPAATPTETPTAAPSTTNGAGSREPPTPAPLAGSASPFAGAEKTTGKPAPPEPQAGGTGRAVTLPNAGDSPTAPAPPATGPQQTASAPAPPPLSGKSPSARGAETPAGASVAEVRQKEPYPATTADGGKANTAAKVPQSGQPLQNAVADLLRAVGGTNRMLGIAAALVVALGAILFILRRRTKLTNLAQMFQSSEFPFSRPKSDSADPADTLATLESAFQSEPLRRSRSVRDEFLRDILGNHIDSEHASAQDDSAIRINSSLKSLLVSDPAQYKEIFLNWIFLAKVGAALNDHQITMDDLDGNFSREFDLLQNYFNIHLLELDDRHKIRRELPGLFYCLQLVQQTHRHGAHGSVAGTA